MKASLVCLLVLVLLYPLLSAGQTCGCSGANPCCSQWGYCGNTADYCGTGCQQGACYGSTPAPTPKPTPVPTTTKPTSAATQGPSSSSSWPNGPIKAVYIDSGINWGNPSSTFTSIVDSGYNLIVLAFLVSGTARDAAAAWSGMSSATQLSTLAYAHNKGAKIIVSAGGATDTPYNSFSGTSYGTTAANWAKAQNLDGLDFDLENFGNGFTSGSMNSAACIQWVADAVNVARGILGSSALVTSAPQPPYFGNQFNFANAYPQIYAKAPSINYLLVQYYNNGPANTYQTIFTSASGASIGEIAALGIPKSKLVVGKPVVPEDAGSQWVAGSTLASFISQAQSGIGWSTGVMGWQWHNTSTNGAWIHAIYP